MGRVKGTLRDYWVRASKSQTQKSLSDGTSHPLFTPGEFKGKQSTNIPPPKSYLVKWSEIFIPNSPYRKQIVLKPNEKKGRSLKSSCTDESSIKKYAGEECWLSTSQTMWRSVSIVGKMAIVAGIINRSDVANYLKTSCIVRVTPARAPPRHQKDAFSFWRQRRSIEKLGHPRCLIMRSCRSSL